MSPARAAKLAPLDWRWQLPTLRGERVRLRELRPSDAPILFALLTADAVSRFTSPPPATLDHFERFIDWTLRHRAAGDYLCFAVSAGESDAALGIFQVRRLDERFEAAEWGFALGTDYWGCGVFQEGAQLVLDFVFNVLGVHRLEARAALLNGRGNAALLKMGAVPEGVLRKSFQRDGEYLDQVLYAILREDWLAAPSSRRTLRPRTAAPDGGVTGPRGAAPRPARAFQLVAAGPSRR
jgi:[ribosomal protein S5]-alanine N-acetyltransferase